MKEISGIHHITAIAGEPQQNIDFYAGILGLRLVKLTVNFDDPYTYHLYYGDGQGTPGTILTFFPWPGALPGRPGNGQVTFTSFAIAEDAMGFWEQRFKEHRIAYEGPFERFGEQVISFKDHDGLQLELIASGASDPKRGWENGPIRWEFAIRGFHSATISEEGYERTAALLTDTMGFRLNNNEGNRFRYIAGDGGSSRTVDLVCSPESSRGRVSAGSVHHIAWRTPNDDQQKEWHKEISRLGYNISPVMDRKYFHSIYYREPGGVLFEIATDPPGFAIDEPADQLGTHLVLPPWLEPQREHLVRRLPKLNLPKAASAS